MCVTCTRIVWCWAFPGRCKCLIVLQWNLSWETTGMRDHLSWKTTHWFLAEGPTFQYNWTCHQRPPERPHFLWYQWGGVSTCSRQVLLYYSMYSPGPELSKMLKSLSIWLKPNPLPMILLSWMSYLTQVAKSKLRLEHFWHFQPWSLQAKVLGHMYKRSNDTGFEHVEGTTPWQGWWKANCRLHHNLTFQ